MKVSINLGSEAKSGMGPTAMHDKAFFLACQNINLRYKDGCLVMQVGQRRRQLKLELRDMQKVRDEGTDASEILRWRLEEITEIEGAIREWEESADERWQDMQWCVVSEMRYRAGRVMKFLGEKFPEVYEMATGIKVEPDVD